MKIKYIMTKENGIVMFSPLLTHDEVAAKFGGAISAGFIGIDCTEGTVCCFGESVSLGLKPAEGDSEKARIQLFEL